MKSRNSRNRAVEDISLALENVTFPSMNGVCRVKISPAIEGKGIVVWSESKITKQQWQVTIIEVGKFGPSGVPEEAVYSCLKATLQKLSENSNEIIKSSETEPTVDMEITDEGVSIILTLTMSGFWHPEYVFPLLPVALEQSDIFQAQLRDAQEEIAVLKSTVEELRAHGQDQIVAFNRAIEDRVVVPAFLSLASTQACVYQQNVVWDSRRLCTESHFAVSADYRQITVLKRGIYQVHVRLGQTNNQSGSSLQLLIGDAVQANCYQSESRSHQGTAQIFEVLELAAKSVLSVRCQANNGSIPDETANRFTVQLLQSL